MGKLLVCIFLFPSFVDGRALSAGRGSGKHVETSEQLRFLHARGGSCVLTTYSVGINGVDAPYGKFVLPIGQAGTVQERPCVFKGESYNEGMMKFECKGSEWVFKDHTCKGRQQTPNQCAYTTHKFTLHGNIGKFKLPLSNVGAVEERPCEFDGESYSEGTVKFKCADGEWQLDSHTCKHPMSGECPPTGYDLKINGFHGTFELPSGHDDASLTENCDFQDKTYKRGEVMFLCEDYKWKFTGHTCTDQPQGGCAAVAFTVTVNDHPGVFQLPDSPDGDKKETPCQFKDKTYTKGVVKFHCSGGKWTFDDSTCTD